MMAVDTTLFRSFLVDSHADIELRSVMTGTRQYSPYQLGHNGNVAITTDDCDHECHAGANEDANIGTNEPNKV